jgi:hypothetical protein
LKEIFAKPHLGLLLPAASKFYSDGGRGITDKAKLVEKRYCFFQKKKLKKNTACKVLRCALKLITTEVNIRESSVITGFYKKLNCS